MQTCWTAAYRANVRPAVLKELVALFTINMLCPAQVRLQTAGFCHGRERKQQTSIAQRCFAARRLPLRARSCVTAKCAAVPYAALSSVSRATRASMRCRSPTLRPTRKLGFSLVGWTGPRWRSDGTSLQGTRSYRLSPIFALWNWAMPSGKGFPCRPLAASCSEKSRTNRRAKAFIESSQAGHTTCTA